MIYYLIHVMNRRYPYFSVEKEKRNKSEGIYKVVFKVYDNNKLENSDKKLASSVNESRQNPITCTNMLVEFMTAIE